MLSFCTLFASLYIQLQRTENPALTIPW